MITSMFMPKSQKEDKVEILLGIVKDIKDPEGANRVRVELLGYTNGIEVKSLVWYTLKSEVSDSPNASVKIPPVGSVVEVEIRDDFMNGVVVGNSANIPPQ